MLRLENASVAAPNTTTSSQPASIAASSPLRFGTSTGYCTPGLRLMPAMTAALSAICGTHFGDTNAVASTTGNPASVRRSINSILTAAGTFCASFCKPSRGPTSTILTFSGMGIDGSIARDAIRRRKAKSVIHRGALRFAGSIHAALRFSRNAVSPSRASSVARTSAIVRAVSATTSAVIGRLATRLICRFAAAIACGPPQYTFDRIRPIDSFRSSTSTISCKSPIRNASAESNSSPDTK